MTAKSKHLPPSPRPISVLSHPLNFLISWTVVVAALPLVIPILLGLYVYRATIRLCARYSQNLTLPLTPYDSIFAMDSYYTRPYASNLTVLQLNSRISLDSVKSTFSKNILSDPSFTKLTWVPVEYGTYWFWKPLQFAKEQILDSAVTLYHDSELDPANKSVDDCLNEIITMPYKHELFNVLLLHFGNKSYIVFRIHHTVCDGYSFNHLIDKFVGMESRYLVSSRTATRGFWDHIASGVLRDIGYWGLLLSHLPLHIINLFRESVTHTPNHYTLRKRSSTGTIRRVIYKLSDLKQIRSATGNSHFASIGMSLMTGALQKFYDQQQQQNPKSQQLRPSRLAIMHSLPKPNHPLTTLCNHWGVGLFKIPFVTDAVTRVFGAEEDFNEYTGLGYDTVLHIHFPIVTLLPNWVVKWFFSINFGTSCGFTSVPGLFDRVAYVGGGGANQPDEDGLKQKQVRGVEVEHMWKVFGLQWRQSAVAVAMYTYRGEASISFFANNDIIPDEVSMDRLMELFNQEFNELLVYSKKTHTNGVNGTAPVSTVLPKQHHTHTLSGKLIDACFNRNNKLA